MDPFIGQIMMFGGNFAPRGWAKCEGQLLPISQNSALFSILGTTYGGDGRTTFGLPDLRGRVPMQPGTGPGLSSRNLGQKGGQERVTLTANEMPAHNHGAQCSDTLGDSRTPAGNVLAGDPDNPYIGSGTDAMSTSFIGQSGGSQPHDNVQPFLCVTFCIALTGIFPSRN